MDNKISRSDIPVYHMPDLLITKIEEHERERRFYVHQDEIKDTSCDLSNTAFYD